MNCPVALFFLLFGSMVLSSDAISCYYCEYDSAHPEEATCDQPFNATSTPTCNGSTCSIASVNSTGTNTFFGLIRNCSDNEIFQADQCEMYEAVLKQYNFTYYTHGNTCCFVYILFMEDGTVLTTTVCLCKTDKCNGDDDILANAEYTRYSMPRNNSSKKSISELLTIIGVVTVVAVLFTVN